MPPAFHHTSAMKKSKYLHSFAKWKVILGQSSTDLKEGDYMLNARDQKIAALYHQELEVLMVRIQKATISEIGRIIQETPMHFSLKAMCDSDYYQHIADFSRRKIKNLSKEAALSFRRSSWKKYIAHKIEPFPYVGVWGGRAKRT